ncbi:MAG: flagellar export chaperone FliS [Deltaproteobacteria bacterium]|jgi:flagellar protein FliS|nr:flagellar export chaperone FliS [Deltaproteobacteria bacterium]
MHTNGGGAYQRASVITADPKRLVLMCYEGAIRNLKIAKAKYVSRDYEEKARALIKAQDFICALNSALDFEKGGEIASNLQALYNYMMHHLTEADLKKDLKAMDHIIWMLVELKSAWEEILTSHSKNINPNLTDREGKIAGRREMRV